MIGFLTVESNFTYCGRRDVTRVSCSVQGAPHTAAVLLADDWNRPYSREAAGFPAPWVKASKFWPTTGTNLAYQETFHQFFCEVADCLVAFK